MSLSLKNVFVLSFRSRFSGREIWSFQTEIKNEIPCLAGRQARRFTPRNDNGAKSFTFTKYNFFLITTVCIISLFIGCGITQPIRPIEEGSSQVIASFGGPIIPVGGIAFPVPYLNLGAMYGYSSNLTLYGNAHITALLFKDVGIDGGFSTSVVSEKDLLPGISFNGRGYFFWDAFRGTTTRFFPMGTVTGSYCVGERSLFYFGADNLYQFTPSALFVSPFVGYSFPISHSMELQIESKWVAMNRHTRHGVFEGAGSIGGKGNIGLFFGLQYSVK